MKKNKENRNLKNIIVFMIVLIIMIMSIICIELITNIYIEKINTSNLGKLKTPTKKDGVTYNTSNLDFTKIIISEDENYIKETCEYGCNIRINMYDMDYEYLISYKNNEYILNIVKDNSLLLSDKNIGTNLDNAYFKMYKNNIVFYNIIVNEYYQYDYMTIVDKQASLDEFSSIESKELELTEEGIVYYYDICDENIGGNLNAKKVKAIRLPFSINPKVMSEENKYYDWCEKAS